MRRIIAVAVAVVLSAGGVTATAAPAMAVTTTASGVLASLTVAGPQQTTTYQRAYFPAWIDADGDGCNTRSEVLQAESKVPVTYTTATGCTVATGEWVSWYDGATWTLASDVDIDHLVPLKEAWVSGAWSWSTKQRQDYANDLSIPYALQAVTDNVNQAKGDKDPALWMPPAATAACQYDQEWVLVKYKWDLTIDAAEKQALENVFAADGCGDQPLAAPDKAGTVAPASTLRLAGTDRYGTAVAISNRSFPSGVPIVYVATGTNYADALSAAPIAAVAGGPLLLTAPSALPSVVGTELARLRPQAIVVVGSSAVVSAQVFDQLHAYAPTVSRVFGSDRYATSRALIGSAFTSASTVFVATGRNFPDALSAAAAAGAQRAPVLLVDGAKGSLDAASGGVIGSLGATSIAIAGATSVVSQGIQNDLARFGTAVRYAGTDRYATSEAINHATFSNPTEAFLATGTNFADALAGAAAAGRDAAPLYVVKPGCIPDATADDLDGFGAITRILLGSTGALSAAVANGTRCSSIVPPTKPTPPPPTKPANPGDTKNCTDFKTWADANAWFQKYYPYYGDVARLDGDGDGIPCESLPGAP